MPWMWARIHCRTNSLGYLRGGFQTLYESLVASIQAHGGEVRLNTEVQSVTPTAGNALQVVSSAGEERYGRVISTLASHVTLRLRLTYQQASASVTSGAWLMVRIV